LGPNQGPQSLFSESKGASCRTKGAEAHRAHCNLSIRVAVVAGLDDVIEAGAELLIVDYIMHLICDRAYSISYASQFSSDFKH